MKTKIKINKKDLQEIEGVDNWNILQPGFYLLCGRVIKLAHSKIKCHCVDCGEQTNNVIKETDGEPNCNGKIKNYLCGYCSIGG